MPTYQYVCTACGQDLEAVQSFSDPALTDCPACSGRLRKKFGSVGVVFKGSGFYRNDSRSSNGSSTAEKSESTSEKAGTSAGGDAKPASTEKSGESKPAAAKESSGGTATGTSSTGTGSTSKSSAGTAA